jgi:hypothetical protein
LPTNQVSPLKPHCIMWSHTYRGSSGKQASDTWELSLTSRELLIASHLTS